MSYVNTNQELPSKTRESLQNCRRNILSIIRQRDLSQEEKKNKSSIIVLTMLREMGMFYKTRTRGFYYFDSFKKRLFRIREDAFKYLLNEYFGINASTDQFKYLIEEISSYIAKYGKEADIHQFSHYDQARNILYVHNNGIRIIRITTECIEEVENGFEGIIFETKPSFEEWNMKYDDEAIPSDRLRLGDILSMINFDSESNIGKNDYMWLLEAYIYALFFPDLLNTRPILAFIGNKGSGKSFFLKLLLRIFYGKEASLSNLPGNDEEFRNSLMNNYLYFIDNLDDSISKTKIDILCSVSTGVGIKKRVLYTDSEELDSKVNSFIAITSRTPKFKRVDLNERLLIFKLQSLERYSSETKIFSKIDRDRIMTEIVFSLQKILGNIRDYQYFDTTFRLADFAVFVGNTHIQGKTREDAMQILEGFTREQEDFSMETDPLIQLLDIILSSEEETQSFTANTLHTKLNQVSHTHYLAEGNSIPYSIKSPIALGKKLSENERGLAYRFGFHIEKGNSNVKYYIFEKMK